MLRALYIFRSKPKAGLQDLGHVFLCALEMHVERRGFELSDAIRMLVRAYRFRVRYIYP
jgi:hypothetical protein